MMNLSGIGAVVNKREGKCIITKFFEASGAEAAGLKVSDLAANAQWRRNNDIGETFVLPGSQISIMRRITQNEFLQVVPKKIPDPTKDK